MIRLLNVIGVLALIGAAILLALCGRLWLQGIPSSQSDPGLSIAERFHTLGAAVAKNGKDVTSPLVEQATAYALYLDPPKPAVPKALPASAVQMQPAFVPPDTTPKFSLLATTYYRNSPEKSLALVSEPGKGDHWVKQNERLGHFVVERVEKGAIFYRDGNQVREMKVTVLQAVQLTPIRSELSTSTQAIKPDLRLANAPQLSSVE